MKKKVLAGLAGAMLISSVALAAPVVDLEKGQTSAGYNFSKFDFEIPGGSLDADTNGFYIEHAVTDKVVIGIDYNKADVELAGIKLFDFKMTDVYAKYKLDENIYATLGNRKYEAPGLDTDEVTFGIEGTAKLDEKVNGYAGIKANSEETEWQIGATYAMTDALNLELNYKFHDQDDFEVKGFGFGINYKF